jgi:hypothetical protein
MVGLLLALSSAPLVRDAALAVIALLAGFFGLQGKDGPGAINVARTAGFGWFVVTFILLGLGIRDNRLLVFEPTSKVQMDNYDKMIENFDKLKPSFGTKQAQRILLFDRYGHIPPGLGGRPYESPSATEQLLSAGKQPRNDEQGPLPVPGMLMGSETDRKWCDAQVPGTYTDYADRRDTYIAADGFWKEIATTIDELPDTIDEATRDELLLSVSRTYCKHIEAE